MPFFVGSPSPATLATVREWNADAAAAQRHRRRMTLGAEPRPEPKLSAARSAACEKLGLAPDADDATIYRAVLTKLALADLVEEQAEGEQTVSFGVGRARLVATGLAAEARRLLAAGLARDLGEAQILAVRRAPGLYR